MQGWESLRCSFIPLSLLEVNLFLDVKHLRVNVIELDLCVLFVSLVVLGETEVHVGELLVDLIQQVVLYETFALRFTSK